MKKFGNYEMHDNIERNIPEVWDFKDAVNVLLNEFKYWCNLHPYDRTRSKLIDVIKFSKLDQTEWYAGPPRSCNNFNLLVNMLPYTLKSPFRLSLLVDEYYLIYDPKTRKPRQKNQQKKRNPLTKSIRHEVFKRDGYRCLECGATNKDTRLHIDHIIPVAQGGSDELDNLQTLCQDCNLAKSNRAWKGGEL